MRRVVYEVLLFARAVEVRINTGAIIVFVSAGNRVGVILDYGVIKRMQNKKAVGIFYYWEIAGLIPMCIFLLLDV